MDLAENEIHLWFARDQTIRDPGLLADYRRLLAPSERERHSRFRFDRHRHQYLIARALVRSVLSLYPGGLAPSGWRFEENEYGKPFIADPRLASVPQFNLSHTEGLVVLAVSAEELGVDVEWLGRGGETTGLADRFFSPCEARQLRALDDEDQRGRFFDLWTLKEAYIKARGMGLALPLDQFSYAFSECGEISISFAAELDDRPEHWSFWQIEPDATHKAALAIKSLGARGAHRLRMKETIPLRSSVDVQFSIVRRSGVRSA